MKIVGTALAFTSMAAYASAFAPNTAPNSMTSLGMSDEAAPAPAEMKQWPSLNGWVADPSKFCAGLPGNVAPLGNFDPLGLTSDMSVEEIKRYREAEVTHGRVAMLATLGYLVGEKFHPLFGGGIDGPANSHLGQVREVAPFFFSLLTVAIGATELSRALKGWKTAQSLADISDDPNSALGARLLDDYYPGDLGFDPLNFKPKNENGFKTMQTKELQNGRLAMLAAIGMITQEQITHETIYETLQGLF